ncbi:hypothetical protein Poli38472_002578 [Pythium oligandrum]|uniref:Uncharacterized protein n=1 Tax=Pythium oligandrum TaxID=41045 RepID=A0A8K1CHS4_PYTOL|nr:hypothetical protein Poli38472_002578 [Pythium oligandrum]|eukprot:TMW63637.1 hypothetical protein Poli38472_002578 [Pythium oligandrum]
MVTPAIQTWRDRLRYELTSPYGLLRQYYNPVLDLPKLLFQTATLVTYLHNGFPVVIISIYTSLLCINWMISSYRYKQWRPDPHYVLARLFYSGKQPSWTTRRRHVQNLLISAVFFCVGVAVFVYSTVAMASTKHVCHAYQQCAVTRLQWNVGATHCSCIEFVDRTTSVKAFAEWENPPDTTANLAALATTGHLRIIQIINPALPEFPEELRGCHDLEQLILIYTKTVRFPSWAKEFRHLEYLHVEGDFMPTQLISLPDDLFEDMHGLVFRYLGGLIKLPRVPDLSRLTHLQHLTLAVLHSITEIPSFDTLVNLRMVTLMDTVQVQELPSISKLRHLQSSH